MSKLCLSACVYKRLFLSTAMFFYALVLCLKKLTDRSTGFVEHSVNRLLKLAFMSVVACIQKDNQLSFVFGRLLQYITNSYMINFNRVCAHGFIMGKSPDFPYLCAYKKVRQLLAFVKQKFYS